MKNSMKKRVLAGSMAVALGAGMTGAYGAAGSGLDEVRAADKKNKEVETLKETAENALEAGKGTEEESTGKLFKDESVYVKADPSGKVKETTVTEWLKNPGSGNVEDESALSGVKNVKGKETFSQRTGNALQWKAKGEDIYYQGTSDGKLPIDVKVSYKLNGRSIRAEELSGKSGKVEITVDYTNHSKETVKVGKKDAEMYTPFAMVTAMMLSADEYSNVQVDNGKVISDGDRNIVLGIGLPGLSDNLKLEETELDLDIPESVKITADVKEATVGPTVTMASTEFMNELDMDDIDSFDELEDSLDELKDASQKLKDGSKDAADGAKKLADGSKDLKDGTKELKNGSGELASGSKQVADGVSTLNDKSKDLIKGVNSLVDGVNTYTSGVGSLAAGSAQVRDGAKQVNNGAAALTDSIKTINGMLSQTASEASSADSQADKAKQQLGAVEKAIDKVGADVEYTGDTKGKVVATKSASEIAGETVGTVSVDVSLSGIPEEYRSEVKAAIEKAEDEANSKLKAQAERVAEKALDSTKVEITEERKAKAVVHTGEAEAAVDKAQGRAEDARADMADLVATLKKLQGALAQLQQGAEELSTGTAGVYAGADTLAKGAEKLNENSTLLTSGTAKLKEGGAQLAGGVKKLDKGAGAVAEGAGKLKDGAGQLDSGAGTLVKGTDALADGNLELSDGMSEFKEEGIDKLAEAFDGDFRDMKDRLEAMSDMGKAYKSYAGIKKGMDGSTKFIIETEGVEKE